MALLRFRLTRGLSLGVGQFLAGGALSATGGHQVTLNLSERDLFCGDFGLKRGANAQAHTLFERARSLWRWAPDLRSALMTQNGRHANAINAPPSAQSATTSQGGTCHMNSNRKAAPAKGKS